MHARGYATTTCPAGTTIQIAAVEEVPSGEWSLVSARKFRGSASEEAARAIYARGPASPCTIDEVADQDIMIQTLTDTTFGKVCVDSG